MLWDRSLITGKGGGDATNWENGGSEFAPPPFKDKVNISASPLRKATPKLAPVPFSGPPPLPVISDHYLIWATLSKLLGGAAVSSHRYQLGVDCSSTY